VPEALCGIGVNFRADRTGALVVSSLIEGGPAFKSGEVLVGDLLYEVDSKIVMRSPLSHVSASLLGPKGSGVNVVFLRNDQQVHVKLVRAPVLACMHARNMCTQRYKPASPPRSLPYRDPRAWVTRACLTMLPVNLSMYIHAWVHLGSARQVPNILSVQKAPDTPGRE
jgi:hypothetical protein